MKRIVGTSLVLIAAIALSACGKHNPEVDYKDVQKFRKTNDGDPTQNYALEPFSIDVEGSGNISAAVGKEVQVTVDVRVHDERIKNYTVNANGPGHLESLGDNSYLYKFTPSTVAKGQQITFEAQVKEADHPALVGNASQTVVTYDVTREVSKPTLNIRGLSHNQTLNEGRSYSFSLNVRHTPGVTPEIHRVAIMGDHEIKDPMVDLSFTPSAPIQTSGGNTVFSYSLDLSQLTVQPIEGKDHYVGCFAVRAFTSGEFSEAKNICFKIKVRISKPVITFVDKGDVVFNVGSDNQLRMNIEIPEGFGELSITPEKGFKKSSFECTAIGGNEVNQDCVFTWSPSCKAKAKVTFTVKAKSSLGRTTVSSQEVKNIEVVKPETECSPQGGKS